MELPMNIDDWIAITEDVLVADDATRWVVTPSCGAVVTFAGTVRDHSEGRQGVSVLEYEAYQEQVVPRLAVIAEVARERWPMIGRVVLWHRVGRLRVGEASVIVAASTPHRPEAFESARFLIDAIKATVPIWKKETWEEGSDWSLCDHEVEDLSLSTDERAALVAAIDRRNVSATGDASIGSDAGR